MSGRDVVGGRGGWRSSVGGNRDSEAGSYCRRAIYITPIPISQIVDAWIKNGRGGRRREVVGARFTHPTSAAGVMEAVPSSE